MQRATRRQVVQGMGTVGLGLVAGCALPFSAPPQAAKVHRIAFLTGSTNTNLVAAFRQGMRDLGYVEGQHLVIEERYANSDDQVAEPAAELVRLEPEAILVPSTTVALVVRANTTTIPIVNAGGGDPVANGLADSYARPGGTVTGLSSPLLGGKQLQLLQEAVPSLSHVAILFDPSNPPRREPTEGAAAALGLQLEFLGAGGAQDLVAVFETAIRQNVDGLFVALGPVITDNQPRIAELAIQSRLPSMWAQTEAVGRGGLMAYGANRAQLYRRAAYFMDRILKRAKPADLPIEEPREFDLVINLQTAQALGLTIPPAVLLQATEVIQ